MQKLIAADPGNAALQFAMGYVHQQQEDWDEASDSYQNSQRLMPGLSDVHSRLAYVLYRADDADSAIAEARTALSIDSRNAEAYRFLGLACMPMPSIQQLFTPSRNPLPCNLTTPTCTTTWESRSATKAIWMLPRLLIARRLR